MDGKQTTCPVCDGEAYQLDLRVRPAVYGCDRCDEIFAADSRIPMATRRCIRRQLMQRWDQLADDVHHLMTDIRDAPEGVFTAEEIADVTRELDINVWEVFANHRPRLPRSPYKRASQEAARRAREDRTRRLGENFVRLNPDLVEGAKEESP